ncbi:accessory gene regulator B family protein [Clostridium sp. MB40-C1]|uniref:accessory gene regulator ArgB-like protein n=1 Tax=Clostridium sp. MB40-C1 TaxID=3070996 RepID=UPI0027E1A3D8|nr:accessory gene regulator B family protein [Clostridium sp. MB40-C1]WMJ79990.1 accessory gene regulator B family protein [Clostridium sp. MB40-C1]
MFLIEKLSNTLAENISSSLNLDDNNKQIIAYGAFSFFQTLWAILFIVILSSIFNVLLQALVLSFTASFLRKYSGGAHATSPNRCALIGGIIFTLLGKLVDKFTLMISIKNTSFILLISFLFSYFIVYKLAPVDSVAKPIKKEETRRKLKKKSIVLINLLLLLSITLLSFYHKFQISNLLIIVQCICLGAAWQSFTLTSVGHLLIRYIDLSIKNIFSRGE